MDKNDPVSQFLISNEINYDSISDWCTKNKIPKITVTSLNDNNSVSFIEKKTPNWVIYGGGGILKDSFIYAAQGRILNAHSGPLPEIRGMNACEWSILLGYKPAVTIHLINRGIDTGGIISKLPVITHPGDSIQVLRNRCVLEGIKALVHIALNPPVEIPKPDINAYSYRQCYIMAPAMKELLEKKLLNPAS